MKKLNGTFDDAIEDNPINKEAGHIKLGDIIIEIDNHSIPSDVKNGDDVSLDRISPKSLYKLRAALALMCVV